MTAWQKKQLLLPPFDQKRLHFKMQKMKCNKKAVLPQGNRAMPQVFFFNEVCQQHSLQV